MRYIRGPIFGTLLFRGYIVMWKTPLEIIELYLRHLYRILH